MSNFFVTPWIIAHQALLPIGDPRQEYWSRLPFPPPGNLPNAGIEPALPALAGAFFITREAAYLNLSMLKCLACGLLH